MILFFSHSRVGLPTGMQAVVIFLSSLTQQTWIPALQSRGVKRSVNPRLQFIHSDIHTFVKINSFYTFTVVFKFAHNNADA